MTKDKILKTIQVLEAELIKLKTELNKPEKFIFVYAEGFTFKVSEYSVSRGQEGKDQDYLTNFRYRQTKINAETDLQLQRELLCIGALAEQIDHEYKSKVQWDSLTWNYYIDFSIPANKYFINNSVNARSLGVVYMPKDVAEKVCEILNNKEVNI